MPAIIRYTVTQTREVKVMANSASDAVQLASAAFENGQDSNFSIHQDKRPEGVWGDTTRKVRETNIHAERMR